MVKKYWFLFTYNCFGLILVTILWSLHPDLALAQARCVDLLGSSALMLTEIHDLPSQISELSGNGRAAILYSTKSFFPPEYIERLKLELPKDPVIELFRYDRKGSGRSAEFDELVEPVYRYAENILKIINDNLPEPERGRMVINILRIVQSNGRQPQIAEKSHIDSIRYLTSVTNLEGAGTVYDAGVVGRSPLGDNFSRPENTRALQPGESLLLNGWVRQMLVPVPGAYALRHNAPAGIGHPRLGIIMFIAPMGMNSPGVYNEINRRPSTPESVAKVIQAARVRYLGLKP